MTEAGSPITASVLSWLIAEDGRSVQEVAEALGVGADDVEAWCAGDSRPSREQVTELATVLHRQRALFFRPSPPPARAGVIRAVVFDVGECLVDESREYGTWADWLGVPRHTFSAVFGAVIARGLDYRETFQVFAPGFDLAAQREARAAAGRPESYGEDDLYSDVRPALDELRRTGVWLGIAGNQTVRSGGILRSLGLPVDLIGTSDDWGVEKPDPAFFRRVAEAAPCAADEILYVGDRLDNDIRPAAAAGLRTALIRRGPWAVIQQHDPDAERIPTMRLDSLAELPNLLAGLTASSR